MFPCKICQGEYLSHECLKMDEAHRLLAPPQYTQHPIILTHLFLKHPWQQMIAQPPPPLQGGNQGPFSILPTILHHYVSRER